MKKVGKPSIFQLFPTFSNFFQLLLCFSNFPTFWRVLAQAGIPGQAQAWPGTLQEVGKLEKHNKSWKFLEILGKLKVFQHFSFKKLKIEGFPTFFIKKVGKLMVSQHSSPKKFENLWFSKVFAHGLAWPGTAQAQARSRPGPGPSRKLESWKNIIKG